MPNDILFRSMQEVQNSLHAWRRANRVSFDPGKESMHIISKITPSASEFKLLGVDFDCKLTMHIAIRSCTIEAAWKLKPILRTQRYFNDRELITLFKSHVLSFIEFRTLAFLHAASSLLQSLDHILERFLSSMGISSLEALVNFNLGSLSARRDIAALGIIHRVFLGRGPAHIKSWFVLEVGHCNKLHVWANIDTRSSCAITMKICIGTI